FLYREIVLGPEAGAFYVVQSGLSEGEEVATNGVFKIDASAQLAGKTSMMNPDGGTAPNSMPGMDMGTGSEEKEMSPVTDKKEKVKGADIQHKMITVAGNCDMCKDRIEAAAKSVNGIMTADWSAEKQMLHLSFDSKQTSLENVEKAIVKVGHDTKKFKADDSVYNALPECCKYRK
nr:efflux RND transporter periplasmic adaptor subunit [Candidatus Delongbacteria bacterium]